MRQDRRSNRRENNQGGIEFKSNFGNFGGPRETHKATCAECNQECEVPFKPAQDRPVYCRDCYRKNKPNNKRF